MKLRAAVAPRASEHIAGKAFGMNAAKNILAVADFALDKRNMVLARKVVHIAVNVERAEFARKVRLCFLDYVPVVNAAIILQCLYRDVF